MPPTRLQALGDSPPRHSRSQSAGACGADTQRTLADRIRDGSLLLGLLAIGGLSACSILDPLGSADGTVRDQVSTAEIVSVTHAPLPTRRFPGVAASVEVLGELQVLSARHENTFSDLAQRHNLGYQELRAANPAVDPWLPGEGTPVYLPTLRIIPDAPRDGIVINLPSMRLLYFSTVDDASAVHARPTVASYPVGIGREGWATPTGAMQVTEKTRNPTWYPPASVRAEHAAAGDPLPAAVPPGPDNPLGLFRLRLSRPNYLLHGTNKPAGVGMRISHGCIRLYPEDIEDLFERVPVDTPVHIVDQPVLAGWRDDRLYLEVHQPLAEDERDLARVAEITIAAALQRGGMAHAQPDAALVELLVRERRGIPVPILGGPDSLEAYLADARVVENSMPPMMRETTASR
jgi:L,D-transpeptidase ErfK/SrfK